MVNGGKISAFGWSLLIHAVIATGFLVTFRFTAPVLQQSPGEVIQAVAIDADALAAREAAKEAARQAELRRQREAAERAAAEQRRREEAVRQAELRRVEEARQRAEAEVRRKQQAEQARREAAEAEARRQAEAERQRKAAEEAKRKAAEAERQRREEAARKEREQDLLQSLEAEQKRMDAISAGKMAQYESLITGKVMRLWSQPPNLDERFYCEFRVRQIPGGEVVTVDVVKCDNDVLRRSAEAAIWKASPLPAPPDPSLFDQYINVVFKPEG